MEPGRKGPLLCSTVMWELENVPNKLGDTTKEISRVLKVMPIFFLFITKCEIKELKN